MKKKSTILKNLSAAVLILFLFSDIAWAAPQFCLRQRPALERTALRLSGYENKDTVLIRYLGEVFRDEDAASGAFEWVANPCVLKAELDRCIRARGSEENVVIVDELCAGRGDRFERSEVIELVARYGLEDELEKRLITKVGEEKAKLILTDYNSRLNNADYADIGIQLLTKTGHVEEIIPKVLYPNPLTGRPFALGVKEAAQTLQLPILVTVGYQADKVMRAMDKDGTTFVFQPGFEATAGFIPPGKWVLGTGYALSQFTRVVPRDFKGAIFVSMGDTPFLDAEVIKQTIDAYFVINKERLNEGSEVRGVSVIGQIFGNPVESSYGRMVFRETKTSSGTNCRVLDRIVEVKDIFAMIAVAVGRTSVKKEDMNKLERTSKVKLLEKAKQDACVMEFLGYLDGRIDISNLRIILPNEDQYSSKELALRKELDNALKNVGLLRERISGRILDGWDLIGSRCYNPGIYLFDHKTLREIIFELKNDNNPREYYATDLPVLLEARGYSVVCVEPTDPWKVEGVNTLPELRERVELITRIKPVGAVALADPDALLKIREECIKAGRKMAERLGIRVETGAVIEFVPGFEPERASVGNRVVAKRDTRVYVGTSDIDIGSDVTFSGGTIIIEPEEEGRPVRIAARTKVYAPDYAWLQRPEVRAINRILRTVAGPIVATDVRNPRGELMIPGLLTMVDELLSRQGLTRPEGRKNFISHQEAGEIIERLRAGNPYIGVQKDVDYIVYDGGKRKLFGRNKYYNTLYDKVIRRQQLDLTDDEIRYCLDNMSDNEVGRHILLYIRAMSGQGTKGYPELWGRITEIALWHVSGDYMRTVWQDVKEGAMIDQRTALPIGNPARNPFGNPRDINYDRLMADIWTRTTVGVFSVSGIRQIFDPTLGDQPLTRFPCRYAVGTEPTLAAKVHAAAQAELFAELLKDPDAFADRIPRLAGQSEQERDALKKNFAELLNKTQQGKAKRDRPRIAILLDTRSTGPALADVDIRALLTQGVGVEYGFVSSVCEAAVYAKTNPNIDGCIYISASHNDEGYNGIKLLLGDGRVMPEAVAYPYIFVLRGDHPGLTGPARVKGVLEDSVYVRGLIQRVSDVNPELVRTTYEMIPKVKERAREADRNYRNRVITGARTDEEAEALISRVREKITPLKLAVICDPNGGAREEAEYLESLGIKVYSISSRHRYDMRHELCPSTAAVRKTDDELKSKKEQAQNEGYTVIGSFHYDTDGDRRNFRPINEQGEFVLREDMAQICFAMDVLGYVLSEYDFKNNRPKRLLGVACNCPTAALIEELAEAFGFVLIRSQTGEAYVVDAMKRLGDMKWAEIKQAVVDNKEEIIVPQCLLDNAEKWFSKQAKKGKVDADELKPKVIAGGEGSNGSDFTPELLVRDPVHTIRSLITFLDPETGKPFVKTLLTRLGKGDEFDAGWWDTPQQMGTLMDRLIKFLPENKTTDFFSIGGPGEKINPPLPLGLVKDNFDNIFETQFRDRTLNGLAKIWGVKKKDISYEYVNTEERAKKGRGNRNLTAEMGRQIGDGGYKIKFYIHKGEQRRAIGWMWFRDSITEAGLTRMGASAVFPALMAGVAPRNLKTILDDTYDFLKQTLDEALEKAVAETDDHVQKAVAVPLTTDTDRERNFLMTLEDI